MTPRESPHRQNSAASAASSSGKTVRPNSASSARHRSTSNSNGGIFARLRGSSPTPVINTPRDEEGEYGEAGPSDWYRRSPSPPAQTLPPAWRQASPNVARFELDEGPSDVWASDSPARSDSRVDSPVNDEKEFYKRLAVLPDRQDEVDEPEAEEVRADRHPAEADEERGGNQATSGGGTDGGDSGSDFRSQVVSDSSISDEYS